MRGDPELAVNAIKTIHDFWKVDADCVEWVGDTSTDTIFKSGYGFDWWPGDFKVQVRASGPHPEIDMPIYRLSVRTDFLSEVDVTSPEFAETVALLNRVAPVFAICAHPPTLMQPMLDQYRVPKSDLDLTSCKVWLSSVAYLNRSTQEWLPRLFAGLTVLQPIESQFRVAPAAFLLHGKADPSSPPQKLYARIDDILNVEQDLAYQGQHKSRWSGTGEFQEIINKWGETEATFGMSDENGLFLETPFENETAFVRLDADQPHPRLGHGLFAVLKIPLFQDQISAEAFAIELNYTEDRFWCKPGFPFIGNWCADNVRGTSFAPTFRCFIPNLWYHPTIAEHVALYLIAKARWVRARWMPDAVDDALIDILNRRYGIETPR